MQGLARLFFGQPSYFLRPARPKKTRRALRERTVSLTFYYMHILFLQQRCVASSRTKELWRQV